MKILTFFLIAVLVACGDNERMPLDQARATILQECGEGPLAPGYSVVFDQVNGFDRVLMTREDFTKLEKWRSDVSTYEACVQGYARD